MTKDDSEKDQDPLQVIPHEREGTRPDYSQPLPRQKLPEALQQNLDNEERFWEVLSSGNADESTNSTVRYAAYASRFRTILSSAHRYVAYTSDIGESFRPVAHPYLVRVAYGISWSYLIGDVSHEGYKAYLRNQKVLNPQQPTDTTSAQGQIVGRVAPIDDYRTVMVQRAVFQSIASMGLPAFTVHSIVRYSGQAFKSVKNPRLRTWGPIGLGLAAVPALPFIFDKSIEEITEWVFHKGFETIGGPSAVGKESVSAQAVHATSSKEL